MELNMKINNTTSTVARLIYFDIKLSVILDSHFQFSICLVLSGCHLGTDQFV